VANGEYGPFEGPAHDRVVLAEYTAQSTFASGVVRRLERLLGAGGTLIDVGANVGLVSVPVAARTGATCIAFEPAPLNAACLRRNIERHGMAQRIAVHELALSERPGRIAFGLSPSNGGDHHVLGPSGGRDAESESVIEVEAARLDDVIDASALTAPIVLKLDVQGAEAKVLRGAARTLPHVAAVVFEYWPRGLVRAGDHAEQLESLLESFAWAALLKRDGSAIEWKTRAQLFHALAHFMALDGSDDGFFDMVLTSKRGLGDEAGS
jgi:FkbM family methyltransferase